MTEETRKAVTPPAPASTLTPVRDAADPTRAANLVRVATPPVPKLTPRAVVSVLVLAAAVGTGIWLFRRGDHAKQPAHATASTGLRGVPDEAWNDPLASLFDAVEARDPAACARATATLPAALPPRDRLRGAMLHARCEMISGSCAIGAARVRVALSGIDGNLSQAVSRELATYCPAR
jgi:hypothetical protein